MQQILHPIIDCFAFILPESFTQKVYSEALISYKDLEKSSAYSDQYEKRLKNDQKKLKNQLKEIAPLRLADLKKEQQEKLDRAKEKLISALITYCFRFFHIP